MLDFDSASLNKTERKKYLQSSSERETCGNLTNSSSIGLYTKLDKSENLTQLSSSNRYYHINWFFKSENCLSYSAEYFSKIVFGLTTKSEQIFSKKTSK